MLAWEVARASAPCKRIEASLARDMNGAASSTSASWGGLACQNAATASATEPGPVHWLRLGLSVGLQGCCCHWPPAEQRIAAKNERPGHMLKRPPHPKCTPSAAARVCSSGADTLSVVVLIKFSVIADGQRVC